jgi:nitronate monooxygenase
MKLATGFSRTLGLSFPLIQAPMAGGPSSPQLVAACSEAGVLGSFGFAYTQPEEMKRQAAWVRERTARPFGINLFLAPQPGPIGAVAQAAALAALAPWYAEMDLPAPSAVQPPYAPELEAQLAAVAEIRPAVFTAHLGELAPKWARELKALGIRLGASATCVAEAERAEALGMDFVIAQGGEAGGHRGSYLRQPNEALTGTLALTRLLVRAVRIPVVAAGGIMDGAGIAAALALGAQAAQLGTAFIPCPESGAPEVHKQAILGAREDETRVTEKFSGRAARGIANRFLREAEAKHLPQIAFPAHNSLTLALRAASAKAGKPDFCALWAGQAAPLARRLPAAELIAALESETVAALRAATSLLKEQS